MKKVKVLFIAFGLMLALVACGGNNAGNNSNDDGATVKETKTFKDETLGLEFNYSSDFEQVDDLSQVELLKNDDGTSYTTEGIEKVFKSSSEEIILISSEAADDSTVEDLKSSIDQIKEIFDSVSSDSEVEYKINSNEIIDINGSKALKTEMVTSGIKTYMLSYIKGDKIICLQYMAQESNYKDENIKVVTDSIKI